MDARINVLSVYLVELNIDIDAARILKDQALSASNPEDIRRNMARMGADARVIDASPNASRLLDVIRTKMGDAVETANRGMIDLSRARGRQFRQSLTNIFEPAASFAFEPSDKNAYLSSSVPCVPVNLPDLSMTATWTSSFNALFFVAKSEEPGAASNSFL